MKRFIALLLVVVIAVTALSITVLAKVKSDQGYVNGKFWEAYLTAYTDYSDITVCYYGNNGNVLTRLYTTMYKITDHSEKWTKYQSDSATKTAGCTWLAGFGWKVESCTANYWINGGSSHTLYVTP